jgi:fimbrial chaperone protein
MHPLFSKAWLKACLATVLMFMLSAVQAGSFMIDPTRIELGPDQMSATLVLRNQDKVAIVIQADARHWRQQDGEDLLTPTRELLVTPPIVTIAPGAEQVLRVALRRPLDPRQEMNYRIFLQEIAPPPQPGFRGVQVALRISLPVFAKAGEGVQSKPIWSARYLAQEHALRLVLENAGAAHLQLQDFALTQKQPQNQNQNQPQSPQTLASRQSPRYLLAGQRQEWVIALDPAVRLSGQKLQLKATTYAGPLEQELALD